MLGIKSRHHAFRQMLCHRTQPHRTQPLSFVEEMDLLELSGIVDKL
jgi:hypothetical protein